MNARTRFLRFSVPFLGASLSACFQEPGYSTDDGALEPASTGLADSELDPSEGSGTSHVGGTDGATPDFTEDDGDDDDDGPPSLPDPVGPTCGNGDLEADEECDDANTLPGDGCNAMCRVETTGCGPGSDVVAEHFPAGIAVCADPNADTCEEDFASLCAPGWHLCSAAEHQARAAGWEVDLGGRRALGVIRCRSAGGAGHYTVSSMAADTPDNCMIGTSRPECPSEFGCNETNDYALCCARIPTCGDGKVDPPLEECDDPTSPACSPVCANRNAGGPSC